MSGSGEDGALVVYENLQPARNWKRIPGTLAPVPLVHGARGIGHPLNQLLWRRQEGQQMREDLLRIVDDGDIAACIDLIEHLADDARFARAGVSNDEEVLVLGIARNA